MLNYAQDMDFRSKKMTTVDVGLGESVMLIVDELERADIIVAYSVDFDLRMIENELSRVVGAAEAEARVQKLRMRSFDPMLWIQARHGKRYKLDHLLLANNIGGKTADGLQAVQWWHTRDMDLLRNYNQEDVRQLAVLCAMPSIELPYNRGTTDAACLSAPVYAWSRIGGPLTGNPRGSVSFGNNKLLVQRVTYNSEAFEEDVLPMLVEFMSHKDNETIPNLLPGQDQAFLRQILKDYRGQHVSPVRLYTHGLNAV